MIKKRLLFCLLMAAPSLSFATDLIEVYNQALSSDQIYQQAISQRLSTREGVPISIAQLLPNINLTANPAVTRTAYSGANVSGPTAFSPRNNTARSYDLALTLNQTVFNYGQFAGVASALATAKGADATLNAALQSLMTRVASAYFAVLRDEENLSYSEASKIAYAEQLDQVKQQFDVGLKTITDVYTAQASYDSSVADYISAQTLLANDRENLRVITGTYYPHLAALSEDFPLISPKPANIDEWVNTSLTQNWSIKASQYSVASAKDIIHEQISGHLPTVSLQGTLDRQYDININGYPNAMDQRQGPSTQTDRVVQLNFNVPIFSGGGVTAEVNQATYNYQLAQQQLEQTRRNTINSTRQNYLGVIAGISKIMADKQTVKSTISSLEGMEESYKVGTETLVDVLNQQQKVFQAQTQYATDRYAFVNSYLALKQAAGTLSFNDLSAINGWLHEQPSKSAMHQFSYHSHKKVEHLKPKSVALITPSVKHLKVAMKKLNAHKLIAKMKKHTKTLA